MQNNWLLRAYIADIVLTTNKIFRALLSTQKTATKCVITASGQTYHPNNKKELHCSLVNWLFLQKPVKAWRARIWFFKSLLVSQQDQNPHRLFSLMVVSLSLDHTDYSHFLCGLCFYNTDVVGDYPDTSPTTCPPAGRP